MRLAASAANLGLWRWDSRNKVWMTDHCRRMLGLTDDAEPTIGALLAKVHNEERDTLQRQIEQSARWGRTFDTACRIVLPDGHISWLSVQGPSTRRQGDPAVHDNVRVTGILATKDWHSRAEAMSK